MVVPSLILLSAKFLTFCVIQSLKLIDRLCSLCVTGFAVVQCFGWKLVKKQIVTESFKSKPFA